MVRKDIFMAKKRRKSPLGRAINTVKYFMLHNFAVPLFVILIKMLTLTWRYRFHNYEEFEKQREFSKNGIISAFWHGDMIGILGAAMKLNKKLPITILISPSRDGEILARLITRLGLRAERGSSAKNPVSSVLILRKVLAENSIISLAVDGPRGKRHEAKIGAVLLSKHSQAPIIPIAVRVKGKITFSSWDRTELPLPFARVDVFISNHIIIDGNSDKETLESERKKLEEILLEIKSS